MLKDYKKQTQPLIFLIASSLGTFLEFFDLALYSFASTMIAKTLFPPNDYNAAILATWAIFAFAFLMRPLGAIFFGYLADVRSSKMVMIVSMIIMAFSTIGIGLIPEYSKIGIWAPILLLLFRIMQSIAVSPEYNLPSVLMKNNSWFSSKFGFVSSLSSCANNLGSMTALWLMAFLLTNSEFSKNENIWRIAFIITGTFVGSLGIYLRTRLQDNSSKNIIQHSPLKLVLSQQGKDLLVAILICGYAMMVSQLLFSYFINQLQTVRSLSAGEALSILSKGTLLPAIFTVIAGYLSDKVSRRLLIMFATFIMAIANYYLFVNIAGNELSKIYSYMYIVLAALGFFYGCLPGFLANIFRTEYRYTGSFLSYNIGTAWIGGVGPIMFLTIAKINTMMPILVIEIYSFIVIALVIKPSIILELDNTPLKS